MLDQIAQVMDPKTEGMHKEEGENSLSYTGFTELQGLTVGVGLLFFGGGVGRAICQLALCPEEQLDTLVQLCNNINAFCPYRAIVDDGLFSLVLDFLCPEAPDPELAMGAVYMLLSAADHFHLGELRGILGDQMASPFPGQPG